MSRDNCSMFLYVPFLSFIPRYKNNATRVSQLMRSHHRTPAEQAVDVIEYILVNGGRVPHLRPYSHNLPWYKLHLLDIYAFIFLVVASIICFIYFIIHARSLSSCITLHTCDQNPSILLVIWHMNELVAVVALKNLLKRNRVKPSMNLLHLRYSKTLYKNGFELKQRLI